MECAEEAGQGVASGLVVVLRIAIPTVHTRTLCWVVRDIVGTYLICTNLDGDCYSSSTWIHNVLSVESRTTHLMSNMTPGAHVMRKNKPCGLFVLALDGVAISRGTARSHIP